MKPPGGATALPTPEPKQGKSCRGVSGLGASRPASVGRAGPPCLQPWLPWGRWVLSFPSSEHVGPRPPRSKAAAAPVGLRGVEDTEVTLMDVGTQAVISLLDTEAQGGRVCRGRTKQACDRVSPGARERQSEGGPGSVCRW